MEKLVQIHMPRLPSASQATRPAQTYKYEKVRENKNSKRKILKQKVKIRVVLITMITMQWLFKEKGTT